MAKKSITITKNYRLFGLTDENRKIEVDNHRKLMESMKEYGFIPEFPIVCKRVSGNLIVVDGQHRLAIAEMLKLPVSYVVTDIDFDIAKINTTSKLWKPIDYAKKFAEAGNKHYQEGLQFSEDNGLSVGIAFAVLSGVEKFGTVKKQFEEGRFVVKDREFAEQVAGVYVPITMLSSELRKSQFLKAVMAVCRVSQFDKNRLLTRAKRCRDKLVNLSTRDAFLDMLEEVYNYGSKTHVGLRAEAVNAMKSRSITASNGKAA